MTDYKMVPVELLTQIYNSGYHAGHHDTVEGRYVDIWPCDMDTFHGDVVAELCSELCAAPPQDNWLSIESAPRDGREILGWRKDCGTLLIRYIAPNEFLTERELGQAMKEGLSESDAETSDWFYADFVSGGRLEGQEVPTLWAPVPEPTNPPQIIPGTTEAQS